ncbi:MAG: DUF692 domain-containing protein [Myxococcales bacterium]|nr:DUF692 domain-containing protein [Myxococcota bacterium]MDW8280745.1 DUF692 domain-containing protein [Myxococcales bacterium]
MPRPICGIGLGLRRPFAEELLHTERRVDFLEITPENWVTYGGRRRQLLERCLERWPTVAHSVSLSVGGPDPLDERFLSALRDLSARMDAPFFSDHVCYSTALGAHLHDLLPLPFTEEAVAHVAARAQQAQEAVGRPLVLENATFYAHMPGGEMDEADFLCAVLEQSGCSLLLDVNNVYVNSLNHGFAPRAFIDRMPLDRVSYLHVAGHTRQADVVIDTHIGPVVDDVWALYRYTLRRAGRLIPTLVEWDQEIPALEVVLEEVERARTEAARALAQEAA